MQKYIGEKYLKEIGSKRTLWKIITATVLITVIILGFAFFMNTNSERVVKQSGNYLKDAAEEYVAHVKHIFHDAEAGMELMAGRYEESPEFIYNTANGNSRNRAIEEVDSESIFKRVEFIDKDGWTANENGKLYDVSGLSYFEKGMSGKSGYEIGMYPGEEKAGIVFYAPVRYEGEISGVAAGYCDKKQMASLLPDSFLGYEYTSFLCDREGRILVPSDNQTSEDVTAWLGGLRGTGDETLNEFHRVFDSGEEGAFVYGEGSGTGNMRITPVGKESLFLVQCFSSEVNQRMTKNANWMVFALETAFIIIFLIYVSAVITAGHRQKKILLRENREMSYVLSGILKLFDRFVLVDLEEDRYKYLSGETSERGGISKEGEYSRLVEYIAEQAAEAGGRKRLFSLLERESIQEHMAEGTDDLRFEYRSGRKALLWENLDVICLERSGGIASKVLITWQDVTNVKEEEARFREALTQAFRMAEEASAAKSDFLSRMSHDIRTPMNAIMGMTAIAAANPEDGERVKDCLEKIDVSSRHLMGIINKVLDMSRIERGKIGLEEENFSISEIIDSLVKIFQAQINEKGQNLEIVKNFVHESVIGDSVRLQQVFDNIMSNAVKFTPEGGRINIEVSEGASIIPGSGRYSFIFEDNGIGMEEEFVSRIFEPFTREQKQIVSGTEGSGLGMSIAKNIVQMMNGEIGVRSRPGKGSRFTVTVHLKIAETAEKNQGSEEKGERRDNMRHEDWNHKRLLLVEDNQLNMEIAEELLKPTGVKLEKARDGKEAVEKVEAHPSGYYDLVLMDIQMPVMNGYDATEAIRKLEGGAYEELPIVAMSANAFSEDISKGKSAGMNGYISKPVERDKLIKAIETWCGL